MKGYQMDPDTLVTVLLGAAGGGVIPIALGYFERSRQRKIAREDTTFERLGSEAASLSARIDELEEERELYYLRYASWREQAYRYRLQLVEARIDPDDDQRLLPPKDGEHAGPH